MQIRWRYRCALLKKRVSTDQSCLLRVSWHLPDGFELHEWLKFQSFLLWLGNLPELPHFTIKSPSANSSRINYFCMTLVDSRFTKFGYFCYNFSCRNDSWRDPLRSEQGRRSDIVSLCYSISLPRFLLPLFSEQVFPGA